MCQVVVDLLRQYPAAGRTGADAVDDLRLFEGPDLAFSDFEQSLQGGPATLEGGQQVVRPGHELVQHGHARDLHLVQGHHLLLLLRVEHSGS